MKLVIRIRENKHEKNFEFLNAAKDDLMSRYTNIEIDVDFNTHFDFNQFVCDDEYLSEAAQRRVYQLFEKF